MISVALKVFSLTVSFFVTVLIARFLGASGYGVYSYVVAIATFLTIPAQFGVANLLVRETAIALSRSNWALAQSILRWAVRFSLVSSLGAAALAIPTLLVFHERISALEPSAMLLGAALIPSLSLMAVYAAALRGMHFAIAGQLPHLVVRPIVLLTLIVALFILFSQLPNPPAAAILANVTASAIAAAAAFYLLQRRRPKHAEPSPTLVHPQAGWNRAVIPLALIGSLQMINQQTDLLMLGIFHSAEDVGTYKAAAQFATFVTLGLQAVNMVLAPRFASEYANRNAEKLQRLAKLSSQVGLLIGFPIALVFLLFGEPLLRTTFGAEFARAYLPLSILACGQALNAAVGAVGVLLNMTGHERDTMRGVAIAAICNVILNVVLIPQFGTTGAAVATSVTLFVWNVILARYTWLRLSIHTLPFSVSQFKRRKRL